MARLIALLLLPACSSGLRYIPADAVSEAGWRDVTPAGVVPAPPPQNERATIAVLPAKIDTNVDVPELFDDYVLAAVQNAGPFQVVGPSDIDTMLGADSERDLPGCTDANCMTTIGHTLGVDFLMTISVARLEGEWVITSKLINIDEARVAARASEFVSGGLTELLTHLPVFVTGLLNNLES